MKLILVTLFAQEMMAFIAKGLIKKAIDKQIIDITCINPRDFADPPHYKVDDYPFSEKLGMLMRVDVLHKAITSVSDYNEYRIVYTCPKGPVFNQEKAQEWAVSNKLMIICGYYEGVDARLFEILNIETVSIGNFVLSSGESAALCIADAVLRLCPGVVGKKKSIENDSIISGMLEHPHYTVPREYMGVSVPDIVVSGNHKEIAKWRRKHSLKTTLYNKSHLLIETPLSASDKRMLGSELKEKDNDIDHY